MIQGKNIHSLVMAAQGEIIATLCRRLSGAEPSPMGRLAIAAVKSMDRS